MKTAPGITVRIAAGIGLVLAVAAIVWIGSPASLAAAGTPQVRIAIGGAPPTAASLALSERQEDFQMGGGVHIKPGEIHPRDLVVIGGSARVEGEVRGDIVVVLGKLYLSGTARRDVVTVLSGWFKDPPARSAAWAAQRYPCPSAPRRDSRCFLPKE